MTLKKKKRIKNTKKISQTNPKTSKTKKYLEKSKKKGNVHFTIQVAAWPSLEQARSDQLQLIEEGIDAYIQRYYIEDKDNVWYRVRVGNFKNKEKAIAIQLIIESITGEKSWLDIIPK